MSAAPTHAAPRVASALSVDSARPSTVAPDALAAPRVRLRRALIGLCLVAGPLLALQSWQLVWQALLPIPLLCLSTHHVARVQTAAILGLLLLGGAVTTYRVGMAVVDWPSTFETNMWTYPLGEMLERGYGVTLEHTHRLWASAVGLVAICQVLTAHIRRERRAVVATSWAALAAISGQGYIGGKRVLENSPHLAFLHGALAQLVFAVVIVSLVVSSVTWLRTTRPVRGEAPDLAPLRTSALLAVLCVYVQIVLGALTRHSGAHLPLGLHITLAVGVLVLVTLLVGRLGSVREQYSASSTTLGAARGAAHASSARVLRRLRRLVVASLHTQLLLGVMVTVSIFVWSQGFDGQVSIGEAVFASLHVAVGAVLLASCVATWLWSQRLSPSPRESTVSVSTSTGGAS